MELRDYLAILSRRKWIIVGTVVATVATTAVASRLMARQYQATVTLRAATGSSLAGGSLRPDDTTYSERLQNTYAKLASSNDVVRRLMADLGLTSKPKIQVSGVPNSELMNVRVETDDARVAAGAANRLAVLLIATVQRSADQSARTADRLFTRRSDALQAQIAHNQREHARLKATGRVDAATQARLAQLKRTINLEFESLAVLRKDYEQYVLARQERVSGLSIVERATRPTHPVSPNDVLLLPLALVLGLIGGSGLAFLVENLSARLYSRDEVERAADAPVVGAIPVARRPKASPFFNGRSMAAEEAFRRLRTTVFAGPRTGGLRSVLVTSAVRGEGKSAVVANLGRAIAQSGRRVLVIDADLRIPTLSKKMGTPGAGLTDVLAGMAPDAAIKAHDNPNLFVLPAGKAIPNPAEMLGSTEMQKLIGDLTQDFDILLIDTPALLAVSDPLVLVPHVHAVLLVVSYGRARREDVRAAAEQLMRMNPRSVSIVVNRSRDETRYGYGYAYGPKDRSVSESKNPKRGTET